MGIFKSTQDNTLPKTSLGLYKVDIFLDGRIILSLNYKNLVFRNPRNYVVNIF